MTPGEDKDLEPLEPEKAGEESLKPTGKRRGLANLRRELSEPEISTPGAQKLLIGELDRLDQENDDLSQYRSRFHDADKKVAILEERSRVHLALEIISGGCLAVGGGLLGFVPSFQDAKAFDNRGFWILAVGVVLLISGVVAKAVRR